MWESDSLSLISYDHITTFKFRHFRMHVVILKVAELVVLGVLVLDKVLLSKNIERMVVLSCMHALAKE